MATAMTKQAVAILSRSDASLFRFHAGPDWQATADRLGEGHCFRVTPLLVAPNAPAGTTERVAARLQKHAAGNAWVRCPPGDAVGALVAELTRLAAPTRPAEATSLTELTSPAELTSLAESTSPAEVTRPRLARQTTELLSLATDPERSDDMSASDDMPDGNEIWLSVEPCPPNEADKAVEIRTAIEATFGKDRAKQLLASARATVARNAEGHKRRILRVGTHAIRLRGA